MGNVIIILILCAIVSGIVIKMVKDKKAGMYDMSDVISASSISDTFFKSAILLNV